jgi:hypothetical protein
MILRHLEEYLGLSKIKLAVDEPHFAPPAILSLSAWLLWSTVSASYDGIAMIA